MLLFFKWFQRVGKKQQNVRIKLRYLLKGILLFDLEEKLDFFFFFLKDTTHFLCILWLFLVVFILILSHLDNILSLASAVLTTTRAARHEQTLPFISSTLSTSSDTFPGIGFHQNIIGRL